MSETTERPSPWTWAWLVWLGVLLAIELPAACNRKVKDTLSEHVWGRWFRPMTWRWVLVAFLAGALSIHFLTEGPALAVCILGAVLGLRIIYVELRARRRARAFMALMRAEQTRRSSKGE